jgi:Amidohydrolase family/Tetratricopeptide repeat
VGPTPVQSVLVLTHVTIIDGTGSPAQPDMAVVITGKRISEIAPSKKIRMPKGAEIVPENGKFLIPGLWDMHVHPHGKEYLPLFIANGVTGIRIMWGNAENHDWRKEVDAGTLIAPHMLIASPIIDGPRPFWLSVSVHNEPEARDAVVKSKQAGADFVKVYTFLPREEYFAIADESKKQGLPFVGHVPMSISAEEASIAGQKSIEHLTGILAACSTRSEELNQASKDDLVEYLDGGKHQFEGPRAHALRDEMLATYSPEKAAALFALFKKNGTWQTPTLTLWHMFSSLDDAAFTSDSRLKFVPVRERESWEPVAFAKQSDSQNTTLSQKDFGMNLRVVGAMQRAGVGILAGTDTGNPYCISGFSLHDELRLMVEAGLTPMEALQTATLNPARFMGRENDFGTVSQGKMADLVVLDADPLQDVRNTTRIAAVVFDGTFIPRSDLDAMLSHAEALANRKPIGTVLFKTIQDKNVGAAIDEYHELQRDQPTAYDFSEDELIGLGYQLLQLKKVTDAIEVFKLSVETYPNSYNTYDSLAEAYMDHGDKDLAIRNYQKSLELNPANHNGAAMLKKLTTE